MDQKLQKDDEIARLDHFLYQYYRLTLH